MIDCTYVHDSYNMNFIRHFVYVTFLIDEEAKVGELTLQNLRHATNCDRKKRIKI